MKSVSVKKIVGVVGALTTLVLFQNCSKTSFKDSSGSLDASSSYLALTDSTDALSGEINIGSGSAAQGSILVGTETAAGLEIPVGYSCSTTSNSNVIRSDVDVATYFVLYELVEGQCMERVCFEDQRENILSKKKLVLSDKCINKLKDGTEYKVYFQDSRRNNYILQTIGLAESYKFDRELKTFVSTDENFKQKYPINVLVANDPRVGASSLTEKQCDHLQ